MLKLDEMEEDALKELFNLSLGRAASTLSEMVDAEVSISVPCLDWAAPKEVAKHLGSLAGASVGLVAMPYRFEFSSEEILPGMAVLLMRYQDVGHFLDLLYGTPIPADMVDQVEVEAMEQVGDVLLYTCTSSLSAFLQSDIDSDPPRYLKGEPQSLLDHLPLTKTEESDLATTPDPEAQLLTLRVDFAIVEKEVTGSIMTWMDGRCVKGMVAELDHLIDDHCP
ncbi:MAG: chemotaxis protein CheC [Magnetococcales bacterium]|nr:chemotaxis protein CheC [Magnetococcales bacterium]